MSEERIIWQPFFNYDDYEFKVWLDRNFARQMATSTLSPERTKRMNELGRDKLKSLGINWLSPYTFYENTGLVSSFHLGHGGKWLGTSDRSIKNLLDDDKKEEPLKYHSHNLEFPKETHALLALFSQWIHYSDILREKS